MRRVREVASGDEGSTLPLIAAFLAFSVALILVVVAATSLYLERKKLLTLADGAALAGAEAFELGDVTLDPANPDALHANLDDRAVRAAVDAYLDAVPDARRDGTAVTVADSPDGSSARVTLESTWTPPIVAFVLPDGLRIEATSTARSVFG